MTARMGREHFDLSAEELLELFHRDKQCGPQGWSPSDDGEWSIGSGARTRFQSMKPLPKFLKQR